MIKYFKELLDTLKKIEKHLAALAETVEYAPSKRNNHTRKGIAVIDAFRNCI